MFTSEITRMHLPQMSKLIPPEVDTLMEIHTDYTCEWYKVSSKEEAELLIDFYHNGEFYVDENKHTSYVHRPFWMHYEWELRHTVDYSKLQYICALSNYDNQEVYFVVLSDVLKDIRKFINTWQDFADIEDGDE